MSSDDQISAFLQITGVDSPEFATFYYDQISAFLQITGVDSPEFATFYLEAKNWRLDEALDLFYVRSVPVATGWDDSSRTAGYSVDYAYQWEQAYELDNSEYKVWESNEWGEPKPHASGGTLESLYRQPFSLMYKGSFEKAKVEASLQNKWLIVNLQSTKEFNSHLLNRDTWSEETMEEAIRANFIFWQVYDDKEEGKKVCTFYRVFSLPTILVIDPITGQQMRSWNGMVQPQDLLEDFFHYMEKGPQEYFQKSSRENVGTSKSYATDKKNKDRHSTTHILEDDLDDEDSPVDTTEDLEDSIDHTAEHVAEVSLRDIEEENILSTTSEAEAKHVYPPLPEEPKGCMELLCRVRIRCPNGRRLQRNFLRIDPIKFLWSFCATQMVESDAKKAFYFMLAIPGAASKILAAGSNLTFEEANLCNALLSLVWV